MTVDLETFQKRFDANTFKMLFSSPESFLIPARWAAGLDLTDTEVSVFEISDPHMGFDTYIDMWIKIFASYTKEYLKCSLVNFQNTLIFIDDNHKLLCDVDILPNNYKGNQLKIKITSTKEVKKKLFDYITDTLFIENRPKIKRMYIQQTQFGTCIDISESLINRNDFQYHPDFYVDIPDPRELWSTYERSSSNVLIAKGPYGVGKSEYVKKLIELANTSSRDVYFIDDPRVCETLNFVDTLRSFKDGSVVIFEDADRLMMRRTSGNEQMSGMLNLTSGIIAKQLKLIFLTNLDNLKEVDGAFLRSGRLFRILEFKLLGNEQANKARAVLGLPLSDSKEPVSLADIHHNVDQPSFNKPIFGLTHT